MKKFLKKIIPNILKQRLITCVNNRVIKNYLNNRVIRNYYQANHNKTALLSYILNPFNKGSFSHTSYFEARSWAKILDELGYNVDIIDYGNSRSIDLSKYDLICGFGDVFQKYFENRLNKAITIYYGTGMHVCHQNHATLRRVKDVYVKKNVWLGRSARYVEKVWTHQTFLVDGIIALGNEVCADSYRKYYDGNVYALNAPFYQTLDAEQIIESRKEESSKHYLWFGSAGLIHKGLDLVLDYFSVNKDINLHICGPIEYEKEFCEVYQKELYGCQNIYTYGFVNIQSTQFEEILKQCAFIVFPSCSEGGSPSVLTAIGNGGLIPIITKETSVETGYQIWIDGFDYGSIDKAIKYSKKLSNDEIKEMQYNNLEFVKKYNAQEIYYEQLKKTIQSIIKEKAHDL